MPDFITDKLFDGLNFSKERLPKGDYDNFVFENCDFSDRYLDNQNFMECRFLDCNLSNANIAHTQFNVVLSDHCKMVGLKFEESNDFLIEVDFTETDLTYTRFEKCDLTTATFQNSILEGVDFSTAQRFNIDSEKNKLKGAMFALGELPNLLKKHQLTIIA